MALDFINKFFKWGYGPNNGPQSWSKFFPIGNNKGVMVLSIKMKK